MSTTLFNNKRMIRKTWTILYCTSVQIWSIVSRKLYQAKGVQKIFLYRGIWKTMIRYIRYSAVHCCQFGSTMLDVVFHFLFVFTPLFSAVFLLPFHSVFPIAYFYPPFPVPVFFSFSLSFSRCSNSSFLPLFVPVLKKR